MIQRLILGISFKDLLEFRYEEAMKEHLNLDDATNVAIKRLGFFTKPSRENVADKPRDVQRNINRWYRYHLQASNFVGNFALNGLMERDYVVWDKSDNVKHICET